MTSKGKWLPGTLGRTGYKYYCQICSRPFDSLYSFEKHIKTEYHFKRDAKHQNNYEDESFQLSTRRSNRLLLNIQKTSPHNTNNNDKNHEQQETPISEDEDYVKCPTCLATIKRNHLAQHLLSYFHFQKSEPNSRRIEPQKSLILDNIHQIALHMPYQCKLCKFYFPQPHLLVHHFEKEHVINNSKKKTTTTKNGNDNNNDHWSCSVCKISARTASGMLKHLKTSSEHAKMDNTIQKSIPIILKRVSLKKCKVCSKQFMLNRAYKSHQSICSEKMRYSNNNNNNNRSSSSENDTIIVEKKSKVQIRKSLRSQTCQNCSFSTTSQSLLLRHENIHREDRIKNFECKVCGSTFYEKFQLSFHEKIHSGKTFKCPYSGCTYIGRCNSEIQQHHNVVHNTVKYFKCDYNDDCDYSTNSKQHYQRHLKLVHKLIHENRFKCTHCPYETNLENGLKRHSLVHASEENSKLYKCPIPKCTYSSRNIENLRVHIYKRKVHPPGTELYNCKLDGTKEKSYKTNKFLEFKYHIREQHGDNPHSHTDSGIFFLAGIRTKVAKDGKEDKYK